MTGMPPLELPTDAALGELRAFGLRYPGAHTKSPWPGHLDLAVNDKTFAYLSVEGEPFVLSCKLPNSSDAALSLPFVTPTGYGLGKSGWVTATITRGRVPVELFKAWIDESYRAQAPKRLSKQCGPAVGAAEPLEPKPRSPAPARKKKRKAPPAKALAQRKKQNPAQKQGNASLERPTGRASAAGRVASRRGGD